MPHWSAGPVESVGCHTNLPLVPGQPGREVPGRAGSKGRTRSQGQPEALQAREASIHLSRRAGWHRWAPRSRASPCRCSPPLPATLLHGGGRRAGTARGGSPGHPAPSPSLRSAFVSLSPGRGIAAGPPAHLDRSQPAQEHPSTKLPGWLPAAWEPGLAAAVLPGTACALSAGLDLPPMPAGLLRARKALSSPGHRLLLGGAGGLFAGREGVRLGPSPAL